jgi:predicted HNH restriction endonuclease
MDKHTCQVCGMRFEDIYGNLGEDFAEAHHVVPLSKLRGKVETRIEDLRTVCANCHRMLHKMQGKKGDVEKLRAIVRRLKR